MIIAMVVMREKPINLPFGHGRYQPFTVLLGMIYDIGFTTLFTMVILTNGSYKPSTSLVGLWHWLSHTRCFL